VRNVAGGPPPGPSHHQPAYASNKRPSTTSNRFFVSALDVRDWFLDFSKLARLIVCHCVTFESHALMQNPYDQHTILIVQKENHMGLEVHPPQPGGKVPGASTAVWIFCESAENLFQSIPVASRLFDAELPDGVVGNSGDVGISPF
jgi:hypothetical protein